MKPCLATGIWLHRVTLWLVFAATGCASAPATPDDLRRVYFEGTCERFIGELSASRAGMEVSDAEATDLDLMQGFCLLRTGRGDAAKELFEAVAAREPHSPQTAEAASQLRAMASMDEFGEVHPQRCDFERAQRVLDMRSLIGNRRPAYFQLLQEVAPDGTVRKSVVLRSRSDGGLDAAVKDEAASCRYAPIDGQASRYAVFFVRFLVWGGHSRGTSLQSVQPPPVKAP